jgi:hypothetical protein
MKVFMKAKECMIAWNRNSNEIEVGPWPDQTKWSRRYQSTGGAAFLNVQEMSHTELVGYLFIEAMHLIIRDNVSPSAVHKAFYQIDEYRDGLAADVPKPFSTKQ